MDVKFGKDEEKAAPVSVESETTVTDENGASETVKDNQPVEEASAQELATISSGSITKAPGLLMGDRLPSFEEIILPRINLVHNVGRLCQTFAPGEIVLGQSTVIYSSRYPQR